MRDPKPAAADARVAVVPDSLRSEHARYGLRYCELGEGRLQRGHARVVADAQRLQRVCGGEARHRVREVALGHDVHLRRAHRRRQVPRGQAH
ncbi:PP92 [Orf virus]|uniref:PP92 n=1 Tax=Orf virus TaxID=10258 RepID=F1AX28_ORFV|nr:PP92 [Orf virus]